jgi:hypothetical protein
MAFWLAPGERSDGQRARNTNTLSDYLLTKDVPLASGAGRRRWNGNYTWRMLVPFGTLAQVETMLRDWRNLTW